MTEKLVDFFNPIFNHKIFRRKNLNFRLRLQFPLGLNWILRALRLNMIFQLSQNILWTDCPGLIQYWQRLYHPIYPYLWNTLFIFKMRYTMEKYTYAQYVDCTLIHTELYIYLLKPTGQRPHPPLSLHPFSYGYFWYLCPVLEWIPFLAVRWT